MNIARILIRVVLLSSLIGGGVYLAKQKQVVQDSEVVREIEEKKEKFQGSVKGITDNLSNQTQQLTTRGQEVGEHVSNILENYVKPTENNQNSDTSSQSNQSNESSQNSSSTEEEDKPIYEETLDYGRYLYCQQVIKDYENQHSEN